MISSAGYTVDEADIVLFAAVSTDFSRLHTDAAYAARGLFGQRVGHGLLGMCLAEGLLSRRRPPDAIAFAWEWEFRAPFFIGDPLRAKARAEATEEGAELSVANEAVTVFNQRNEVVQRGCHLLARPRNGEGPGWAEKALSGPAPGFTEFQASDAEPIPPSTTRQEFADETGVFFEDLAVGDEFHTPRFTVGDYEASAFAGLTGEAGTWFHAVPAAHAAGLRDRVVAPLYGLALVEGLKYSLAPDRGVGIPMASLSWRWRQAAPIYPGDTLFVEVTVQGKRASRSKTDRGVVAQAISLIAEGRGVVQHGQHVQMFRRRPPARRNP
ncbi:MAG: MaoC/PaaZ C-terminal domain-containing protein [Rhodospirillales bacterium]|nr:MaoC/PaaZ C-terminal domain-containing protein [Rhodospirillales bacterium]